MGPLTPHPLPNLVYVAIWISVGTAEETHAVVQDCRLKAHFAEMDPIRDQV